MMRVVLRIASGSCEGRTVLLRDGQTVTVGRTAKADLVLPDDAHMSGVHFSITWKRQKCRLHDLGSTNGTQVNGLPASECDLRNGDEILAGQTQFVLEFAGAERAVAVDAGDAAGAPPTSASPAVARATLKLADVQPALGPAADIRTRNDRPFADAIRDDDPEVRRAAMFAAAWTGQRWLLDYCRQIVATPDAEHCEAMEWLGILGERADLERIRAITRMPGLGSRRFHVAASYGHPAVVDDLLEAMKDPDPNVAIAAGQAFTKITGKDVESGERVDLPPEDGSDPDEFEREFLEQAMLPDPQASQQSWNEIQNQFANGVRWRHGIEVSGDLPSESLDQLDMEGRFQFLVRAKHFGRFDGRLHDLLYRAVKTGPAIVPRRRPEA